MGAKQKQKHNKEIYYISIVEKYFFKHRVVRDDEILGEYLYDMFISILEKTGEEIDYEPSNNHLMFFSQVDSGHKLRRFIVSEGLFYVFKKYCVHNLANTLNKYGERQRAKGKQALIMLNSGELNINEFNNY